MKGDRERVVPQAQANKAIALVTAFERTRQRWPEAPCADVSFGPYRVARLLGSGRMGSVYLAERDDGLFGEPVALRILSAGPMAGFRERFAADRQHLAALNHPHIAKLLDGGTTPDGAPYVVSELVWGQPIDEYCDARWLAVDERLRLFLGVCEAVEHAHRHLIIHRDLKPSNMLVTCRGVLKLLDCGMARLSGDAPLSSATMASATPRYSSPEQLRAGPVDVVSDVYSLGVVLYELVAGAWPFGPDVSPGAVLRRLWQNSVPILPHLAMTADAAAKRSSSFQALRRKLCGDLASVLMKALEYDSNRRYASVRAFADDVDAVLQVRPVRAVTPTAAYRARKFVQRHFLAFWSGR